MVQFVSKLKKALAGKSKKKRIQLKLLIVGTKDFIKGWTTALKRNLPAPEIMCLAREGRDLRLVPVSQQVEELNDGYDIILIDKAMTEADPKHWDPALASLHKAIIEVNRARSAGHFLIILYPSPDTELEIIKEMQKMQQVKEAGLL